MQHHSVRKSKESLDTHTKNPTALTFPDRVVNSCSSRRCRHRAPSPSTNRVELTPLQNRKRSLGKQSIPKFDTSSIRDQFAVCIELSGKSPVFRTAVTCFDEHQHTLGSNEGNVCGGEKVTFGRNRNCSLVRRLQQKMHHHHARKYNPRLI